MWSDSIALIIYISNFSVSIYEFAVQNTYTCKKIYIIYQVYTLVSMFKQIIDQ